MVEECWSQELKALTGHVVSTDMMIDENRMRSGAVQPPLFLFSWGPTQGMLLPIAGVCLPISINLI